MIHIQIDVAESLGRLMDISNALQNPQRLYRVLGETLLTVHKKRFNEQQSPEGVPWQPLTPKSYAKKRKNQNKILIEEGRLRDTLHYRENSSGVQLGSGLVYAGRHHFGGGGIPARPWIGVNADNERLLMLKTQNYIRSVLR